MRTLRRALSTMLALAMIMAMTVVPALAATVGQATLTNGEILSGKGYNLAVRISNTGSASGLFGFTPGDSSINAFQIEVPAAILDAPVVQLPAGWSGDFDPEIGFIYATADDGTGLAPGASMEVGLSGTADRIPADRERKMPVFVSSNNGTTLVSAGQPLLTSRVLQVLSGTVVKPANAVNTVTTEVTEQQDNATVDVTVINHASGPLDVTVGVEQTGGSSTISVSPATTSIAGGETSQTVSFPVTFGAAGTLQLDATATATGAAARPVNLAPIAVQQKVALTYVPDSLSPTTVRQGADVAFSLRVDKVGAQETVDAVHTLTFLDFSASSATDFTDGSVPNGLITFPATNVDETYDNGSFPASMRTVGIDGNGAVIDLTILPGNIVLDNLAPVVNLLVDLGEAAVDGATAAAGDGRTITFSGGARLGDEVDAPLCVQCSITGARIVTDAGAFPISLTINNGNISGSGSYTFPVGATTAFAEVTVAKVNGLSGVGTSVDFAVDLIAPFITQALTQRDEDGDSVLVTMSELVDGDATTAADWSVDDNFVTAVQPVGDAAATNQFILTLSQPFGSVNATPAVSYTQFFLNGTVFDRVELDLLDQVIDATDGIFPASAILDTVSTAGDDGAYGLQGDAFYTNNSLPTLALSNLVAGDLINVYWDRNDNEQIDSGELVGSGSASGATTEVTLSTSLGDTDETHDLLIAVRDSGGNQAAVTLAPLVLDFSVPEITGFVADGNTVTVTFSEVLPRGRDAAFDWQVYAIQDNEGAFRTVESVTVSGDGLTRTLNVATSSYDSTRGDITAVRFSSRAAAEEQYEDRATNELGSQVWGTTS